MHPGNPDPHDRPHEPLLQVRDLRVDVGERNVLRSR
jgi:hypothetical protein